MHKSAVSDFLRAHQKTIGIFVFLLVLSGITSAIEPSFLQVKNLSDLLRYTGLFGLISVGVAFVIITGGIDLSIGSVVGLCGVLMPRLMMDAGWSTTGTMLLVLGLSLFIGLFHGLLITGLQLQPFLVTLCGLFIYRGIARMIGGDSTAGFRGQYEDLREGLVKYEVLGFIPMAFVVLLVIAFVAAVFLNRTVYGRYLLALGRNEEAARFSGIATKRMKIVAYMICSGLAGLAGMLFILDVNSATGSSFGNFYELYAIAGAVLGGCSLRGGQGAIAGVVLGAALVQVIERATLFVADDSAKYMVIGSFILIGVIIDELLNRYVERRRALRATG